MPYLSLKPDKPIFPKIQFVWEATLTEKILSQEVIYIRKLHFLGVKLSEIKFPLEVKFSWKLYFPIWQLDLKSRKLKI